jgi:cation:H+ antiporter
LARLLASFSPIPRSDVPDLSSQPLWIQLLLFASATVIVSIAGSRLARYADVISLKLHLARAFIGMLLLGAITSLPEMTAVSTGAAYGNAPLAVNNLLGSLSVNVTIIAVADAAIGEGALSSLVKDSGVLFQAILSMFATTLVVAAMAVGSGQILGIGYWSIVLFGFVLFAFWAASGYRDRAPLSLAGDAPTDPAETQSRSQARHGPSSRRLIEASIPALVLRIAGASAAILACGYTLARTSEGIGRQLGLSSGLSGYLRIGITTSLPELVTILAATRLGRIDMAVGEVFGTNLFNIGLIGLADVLYRKGPILNQSGRFEMAACLISLLLTGLYALGLMERRRRTILRMGFDSVLVVSTYVAGLLVLHSVG